MYVARSCRCCLRRAPHRELTAPYTHRGSTEIYSDMLKQCFEIHLILDSNDKVGICEVCVGRLRDASDFKLQVQRSQEELQARLQDTQGALQVKEEKPEAESILPDGVSSEEPELCEEPSVKPEIQDEGGTSDDEKRTIWQDEPAVGAGLVNDSGAGVWIWEEGAVKAEVPGDEDCTSISQQSQKPTHKYCIVPKCNNTIKNAPDKVFFLVPRGTDIRRKWCEIMKRDMVSPTTCLHCCEDHFDVEKDTDNFMEYNIMQLQEKQKTTLRLKEGALPHKFHCQMDTQSKPPTVKKAFLKRIHIEIIEGAPPPAKRSVSVRDSLSENHLEVVRNSSPSHIYIEEPENAGCGISNVHSSTGKIDNFGCDNCTGGVCVNKIVNVFPTLSFAEKRAVIQRGRCTPELELVQKGKVNRKFNTKQYETFSWLTGCIHSNRLFCFPCLLFANGKTVWNGAGYMDVHNFPTAAKKHDQSEKHLESCLKYHTFGKNLIVTSSDSPVQIDIDRHNAKVDRNRNIFQRLIDIVCFLGKQELAFGGHDESAALVNRGNYLEMVDFLAKYDGVLENHLQTFTSSFTGLSNRIQNDLISSVATVVVETIKRQISASDFVAVMVEETPDVSGREQLVLILRYFSESEVCDRFIKYINVSSDRTENTISQIILQILTEFECLGKIIAQTYDGAAVLSSELNGVQSLVRQQCPLAVCVWCSAHILNLVLAKSCERIPETKRFFNIIKTIADFFNNNTKRQAHYNKLADVKKLPRVADTWTYNSRTVNVIFNSCQHLIDLFEDMSENEESWDGETLCQVASLLHNLKEFEFQFLLHVFNEIFAETDTLYEIIQKKTSDVVYCTKKTKDFESFLRSFRSKYEIIFEGVEKITGPPRRKRNDFEAKANFRRIFLEIVDNISSECQNRYKNLKDLTFFELLSHENFNTYKNHFPEELIAQFVNVYNIYNFNVERLTNELKCVYKSAQFNNMSIYNMIQYLYENNLNTVFPEVLRLAKLIVTIPASSASTERSFSSLKRIHTYLRNTQGQQRLTDLSMISTEKTLLTEMKRLPNFYDSILQVYLQKDRRVDLIYK